MRTFRLIEEYYNSPELGTVIGEEQPKYFIGFDPATEDGDYSITFSIKNGIMEQIFPDKKPEFRIIYYKVKETAKRLSGAILDHYLIPELASYNDVEIFKIERRSDGEQFTIGETVKLKYATSSFKITEFNSDSEQEMFVNLDYYFCKIKLSQLIKL